MAKLPKRWVHGHDAVDVQARAGVEGAASRSVQAWEYNVLRGTCGSDGILARCGHQGWELVAVCNTNTPGYFYFYFKRPNEYVDIPIDAPPVAEMPPFDPDCICNPQFVRFRYDPCEWDCPRHGHVITSQ